MKPLFKIILSLILILSSMTLLAVDIFNFGGESLDPAFLSIVEKATEDFNLVLLGKKPLHAQVDHDRPLPSDGGTEFFKAEGYSLEIVKSLVRVAGVDGYMYGPIIHFEKHVTHGNYNKISQVNYYSIDALERLFENSMGSVQKSVSFL